MPKLDRKIKEPSILVRPVSRFGGLDNIHMALIALVIILILLVVAMSYSKGVPIYNATTTIASNNSSGPIHNASQAKMEAEKVLAGYAASNSSLALLPYLSNVSGANVSYVPATRQWYVTIPYTGPLGGKQYLFAVLMDDSNLSAFSTMVQSSGPASASQDYVIAPGVIKLAGKPSCSVSNPVPVYWFIDPYAPGSIQSLTNASALERKFGSSVNLTVKVLFAQASQGVAKVYGANDTLDLGKYLFCGAEQSNFTGFVNSINATYQDAYVPAYVLQELAGQAGMNVSALNACVQGSQDAINAQALQAKYYNITSSSAVVTDCQYMSIPQTARNSVCYSNPGIC